MYYYWYAMLCSSTSFTRARISYCSVPSLVVRSCAHIPQLFVSGRSVCISRKVCLFFRRNYKIFFELKSVSEIWTKFLIICFSKVGKIGSKKVPNLFCGIVNQAAVRKLVNFWFDRDLIQLISWSCDDDGIIFIGFFFFFFGHFISRCAIFHAGELIKVAKHNVFLQAC